MKYSVKYILNWFPGLSWCLNPCSLEEKQGFYKGPGVVIFQPATWLRNKMLSSRSIMSPGDNFPCSVFVKSAHIQFSSIHSLSCVRLFATPWTAAHQASLSITNFQSPPKPMSIELVMPSNHLIHCRPLLLLPSISPSIRVFSNESTLHMRWPKYWSFSFSIISSNEHPGLISFRMDWLDLLAVQGTLKSLLQYHKFKSINSSALSFLYSPTLTSIHDHWKNHSLD